MAWARNSSVVMLQAFAADTTPLGAARMVASGSFPSLVASGGHIALAWDEPTAQAMMQELDTDGNSIGSPFTAGPASYDFYDVMPAADGYMVLSGMSGAVTVADVTFAGTISTTNPIPSSGILERGLTRGGTGYLAATEGGTGDFVYTLDATGIPLAAGTMVPIGSADGITVMDIAGDATHYVTEAVDDLDEILTTDFDLSGNATTGATVLGTVTTSGIALPALAIAGGRRAFLMSLFSPTNMRILETCQ